MSRNSVNYGILPLESKEECHFFFTTETPRNHKNGSDLSLPFQEKITLTIISQDKLEFYGKAC